MLVHEHFDLRKLRTPDRTLAVYKNMYGELDPIDIKGVYGIEIEAENFKPEKKRDVYTFSYVNDGSLKEKGIELVSIPLNNNTLPYFFNELINLNKVQNFTFSHRTSVHVHMNVQNLELEQLKTLIATYIVTENAFFEVTDKIRKGNTYCYPLAGTNFTWDHLFGNIITDAYKYAALNPHHLVDLGTLEFRQHHGTSDPEELLTWIRYIDNLYKFITENDPKEIQKEILELNTVSNYYDFIIRTTGIKPNMLFTAAKEYIKNNVMSAKLFLTEIE